MFYSRGPKETEMQNKQATGFQNKERKHGK